MLHSQEYRLLGRVFGARDRKSSHRAASKLLVESLEPRTMMSASAMSVPPRPSLHSGQLRIDGTPGNDTVIVSGSSNHLKVIQRWQGGSRQTVWHRVNHIKFTAGEGTNSFRNDTAIRSLAFGGSGRDTFIGGRGTDYLYGDQGNDILWDPAKGYLYGGDGDDQLRAVIGNWPTEMHGGPGNDQLFYRTSIGPWVPIPGDEYPVPSGEINALATAASRSCDAAIESLFGPQAGEEGLARLR